MAVKKDLKSKVRYCVKARTESRVWLDFFKDIFLMYPQQRKFLFQFITDLSHDDNNLMTMVSLDAPVNVVFADAVDDDGDGADADDGGIYGPGFHRQHCNR